MTLASVAPEKQRSLTWPGLIDDGLNRWEQLQPYAKNKIDLYRALAKNGDGLQAAQAFRRAVSSGDFSTWLNDVFASLSASDDSLYQFLKLLQALGARIITTYYDTLIEKHTGMSHLDASDEAGVNAFFTDADAQVHPQVFHVHGRWNNPQHVVFDPLDYQKVVAEGANAGGVFIVQQRMRQLLTTHCVLFIGCGATLTDPHFNALLGYANELNHNSPNRHVLLLPGIPRAGDPQFLSVQRLNQGTREQLLPSLRSLFPSLQQLLAVPHSSLPELFAADLSTISIPLDMANWLVAKLQASPAGFPADRAVSITDRSDHMIFDLLGMAADPKVEYEGRAREELKLLYSSGVLEAMDTLLAHATRWKQQKKQFQRLVVFNSVMAEDWPMVSFFLLRCPLRAGAGAAASSFQVFNHQGPMDANIYLSAAAAQEHLAQEALPRFTGDLRDYRAIATWLKSQGIDMEDFDEMTDHHQQMIMKAEEWLRRRCGTARVLSDRNSYQFKHRCEKWKEDSSDRVNYVHESAMKIALVAKGFRVGKADKRSLRANLQMHG